jgi:hypothetical protein
MNEERLNALAREVWAKVWSVLTEEVESPARDRIADAADQAFRATVLAEGYGPQREWKVQEILDREG